MIITVNASQISISCDTPPPNFILKWVLVRYFENGVCISDSMFFVTVQDHQEHRLHQLELTGGAVEEEV